MSEPTGLRQRRRAAIVEAEPPLWSLLEDVLAEIDVALVPLTRGQRPDLVFVHHQQGAPLPEQVALAKQRAPGAKVVVLLPVAPKMPVFWPAKT